MNRDQIRTQTTPWGHWTRLLRDERGSQTIEFVLWVPIISALVVLVVDSATLYRAHSEMWVVARDTARRMSLGQLPSASAAEQYVTGVMAHFGAPIVVNATYDPDSTMEVVISVGRADISIVGYGTHTILGGQMVARVTMPSAAAGNSS